MTSIKPASWTYAEEFVAESEVHERARLRGAEMGASAVAPGTGPALRMLAAASRAMSVCEIGTGAGSSGLWLLEGMPEGGVLTTIDVRQTMREKLDIDFEPYVILGACNPALAHRALTAEHELGLLLPCNVVVHEHDGTTAVSIVDPVQMLGFVGDNPEVSTVAAEAAARLRRVITALERSPEASAAATT